MCRQGRRDAKVVIRFPFLRNWSAFCITEPLLAQHCLLLTRPGEPPDPDTQGRNLWSHPAGTPSWNNSCCLPSKNWYLIYLGKMMEGGEGWAESPSIFFALEPLSHLHWLPLRATKLWDFFSTRWKWMQTNQFPKASVHSHRVTSHLKQSQHALHHPNQCRQSLAAKDTLLSLNCRPTREHRSRLQTARTKRLCRRQAHRRVSPNKERRPFVRKSVAVSGSCGVRINNFGVLSLGQKQHRDSGPSPTYRCAWRLFWKKADRFQTNRLRSNNDKTHI